MSPGWIKEIMRLSVLMITAIVAGLILDRVAMALVIALFVYFFWHLYNIFRLEAWLRAGRKSTPPEAPGIWEEIFFHFYRWQRRYRSRKRRLGSLIREFRESTAAMPDGTVVLNENWEIVWFNSAAAQFLNLHNPNDSGQRIVNLVRSPAFVNYVKSGEFREPVEIASPSREGQHLSLHVIPYGNEQRLLLIRDVTRIFHLEQMRREFVANASHEMRSPLTVINGYLEAFAEDPGIQEAWEAPIEEMRRQSQRMSGIIDDLLELSRLETEGIEAEKDDVDVPGLIARIREEALAMGDGPNDIEIRYESRCHLQGSEKEIYSAFSNLVFNAMRYTPATGSVTAIWAETDHGPCFTVEDTGVGIASEHLPRLTERFYRVDASRVRSRGGTGLGLAIVKHVLNRHGGSLEIASQPGRGSTFTCRFPRSRYAPPKGH